MKHLLASYQVATGQVFNHSKRNLYLGTCNPRKKRAIISQLDIPLAGPPTSYLGVPLFLGSSRKTHFSKLLEALHARITGWKTKFLSFAGRLVLVRQVLSSMPIHLALSIPIPIKVCHSIEKLFRNFLWSANPNQTKRNLIKWKVVCLPKEEGGLGLRRVKEMNEPCILKLGWLAMTSSSIWEFG